MEIQFLHGVRSGAAAISIAMLLGLGVWAQQPVLKSQIRVTVQDETGTPIAAASVQIKQQTRLVALVETNEKGEAAASNVPAGTYEVVVEKQGFEIRAQRDLAFGAGQDLEIRVVLVPKTELKDEISVTASAGNAGLPEQTSSPAEEMQRDKLRQLPSQPTQVADALPLLPGVVRSPQGEIKISGSGENRSAFIVNSADVTDPATGQFGMTVPVDSVQTVNVFKTPYLAQYGRFTAGVVSVETRRGGDKWNFELNDPLPEFRILNGHLRGMRDATPRVVFNGPLIKDRLFISEGIEYAIRKRPVQTLDYPNKETKSESINSFTQLDYIVSGTQTLTGTFHFAPRRDSFVNLDFFNPRPVTPNSSGRDYTGTLIDRLTIGEHLLESTISAKNYTVNIWGQGSADMVLTPTGNSGNYFSRQNRDATRVEWMETFSLKPIRSLGTHNLKFGSALARTSNDGQFNASAINLLDGQRRLLRRIEFLGGTPFDLDDREAHLFAQDHWNVTSRLAVDLGTRFEWQRITQTFRLAPRVGIAWTPFSHQRTVVRTGFGYFYDRVPLSVYAFDRYPRQSITDYAADGSVLDGPRLLENFTDTVPRGHLPLIFGGREKFGNFAPYSSTWNLEVEHAFNRHLKARLNYMHSDSSGIVRITPKTLLGTDALVMDGGGASTYRQLEMTARITWGGEKQSLFLSYVNSKSRGNINEFNTYIGNYPFPIVRADQYTRLGADLPHRFLAWGTFQLPWKLRYSPIVEYRNGFPYSAVDPLQNYVGEANALRFPRFFSLDSRVSRQFQLDPKYALRFSVSGFNLTNHFNAVDVHRNIADPQSGVFFGNRQRFFRVDFDVIF